MQHTQRGLTLIELLVSLLVMALMAGMVWQGMDGLLRTREYLTTVQTQQATLQGTLAQWETDWQETVAAGLVKPVQFDGKTLLLVRRSFAPGPSAITEGWTVVGWRLGSAPNGQAAPMTRWASATCVQTTCLGLVVERAQRWAQADVKESIDQLSELTPVVDARVLYAVKQTWANPLSSTGDLSLASPDAVTRPFQAVPQAVRLTLTLPVAGSNVLTKDWLNPAVVLPKTL